MARPDPPIVECRGVSRVYRTRRHDVRALDGVSFAVRAGEYVAIAGPSGSGKSTLLQLLGALDEATTGSVLLRGVPLEGLRDRERTRIRLREIGFVFQRFHLLPVLTARENVELPMAEAGVPAPERLERAAELLRYVGLLERADHRATELSGGEMQRVAIARALANRPALVLADEPTGELDAVTGEQILDLFDRLNGDGVTLIVVSHDRGLAARASRTLRLRDGRLLDDRDAWG